MTVTLERTTATRSESAPEAVAVAQDGHPDHPGSGLSGAFAKLFAGGLLGKLLGVVREIALAATFGTGLSAGAFRAGQTATNVLSHTFTGDTLNAGFIPLCSRYVRTEPHRAQSLFWTLATLLGGIGLVIAAVLLTGAPLLARWLVPGFPPQAQALTAGMIRAMAIGAPFYVLGALFSYMEMAHGRYLIAAVRAPIQNVGLLLGIGAAFWLSDPLFLAWGFAAYAVLFSVFGLLALVRNGLVGIPDRLMWGEAAGVLKEFGRLVRPLLFLPLVFQASLVVERMVASLISPDAVASLDYAKFFSESGLALLAVPLGMAGLSELGRMDADKAHRTLERTIALLLTLMIPCSVFLAVSGAPLISVVLARGEFGPDAVQTTSMILTGLALGFWAQVAGYVLLKALSVRERNREVLLITALASAAHISVNVLLHRYLGALSLGLAIGAYGLVLFALTVKATAVLDTVIKTVGPLLGGVALYLPLALLVPGDGVVALGGSALLALGFWGGFVLVLPRYRTLILASLASRRPDRGAT